MFYHLKSTNDRELTGDVMLKKEHVSSIFGIKVITKKETYFHLEVYFLGGKSCCANFNTIEEAKAIMYDLISSHDVDNYIFQLEDKRDKDELLATLREISNRH
jgi:hypothetical protein